MKDILYYLTFTTVIITTSHIQAQTDILTDTENPEEIHTTPEIAYLLSYYVKIESESGNEGRAGAFLSRLCELRGLNVRRFSEEDDSYNFAASLYPLESGKPNIILLNHIDVVSHGNDENWTYPPYSGYISNGMVWGRGALDNKGMAIMQLEALTDLIGLAKSESLPFNVTLLSVSGEEVGGEKGAKFISENFLQELRPAVILGEGGSGISGIVSSNNDQVIYGVSVAQKRGLWLRLSLEMNTSGHGSVPPKEYVNKVMISALARLSAQNQRLSFSKSAKEMFKALGRHEKGLRGFALRNIGLLKPLVAPIIRTQEMISALVSNTITLTNMSNPPASVNVISRSAEAILDCRLLPESDTEEFIEMIHKTLNDSRININVIQETTRADCSEIGAYFNLLSDAIKSIYPGSGVVPILFPAFNDNNYFRSKGIPVYGILPVQLDMELLEGIHNVDERISIQSLLEGRDVYREFLLEMMNSSLNPRGVSFLYMENDLIKTSVKGSN